MRISISCVSDIGKERTCNEDAFIVCPKLEKQQWDMEANDGFVPISEMGTLAVVADGIGGAGFGDVAADTAMKKVKETFTMDAVRASIKKQDFHGLMAKAVDAADQAICQHVEENPDTMGMGCTMLMAWVKDHKSHIAWVGDSRAYLFSPKNGLKKLTKDHSLVQQMVDTGEITQEEAFTHPDNNIITRSIGDCDVEKQPEFVETEISEGDVILLCSDGLCGYCTDKVIEKGIRMTFPDAKLMGAKLLEMALDAGGGDNICIAVLVFANDDSQPKFQQSVWQRLLHFFKG